MCLKTNLESIGAGARPYGGPGTSKTQRNSEKRKEKSRDAARCRRGKESEIFTELANALPLPPQTISQLDKASVMRLTLAYLKTRALCKAGFCKIVECADGSSKSKLEVEMDGFLLKALDGFVLVLSADGDIVYTSDNIADFLGLPQVDVMGQSLYEYAHPCDHDEIRDLISSKGQQGSRITFIRLKCTLTAKGRSINLKSASYKVVQVAGEVVGTEEEQKWLVALATPVPHPSNIEFPLDKQTFVSKHSLDMKFTYVDDNVGEFCGYLAEELVGRSLYEMHHALDSDLVKDAYKILRNKGQVETGRYRFLARRGGYIWLVTQATLIHAPKDHKPQYVVCLNYVVSGIESPGEILSELQLMRQSSSNDTNNDNNNSNNKIINKSPTATAPGPPVVKGIATPTAPVAKSDTEPKVVGELQSGPNVRVSHNTPPRPPVAATFKIFAPRTEDMNKGYLMFSDDDPQCTVLKEEPEDLTHLAPSVGDACIPLLEVLPLEEDQNSCSSSQDNHLRIPNLEDMLTFQCNNSEILISSPVPDNSEERESSPKYLYDEGRLSNGYKCLNSSLSGGKIVIQRSHCHTPLSDAGSPYLRGVGTPEPPKPLLSQAALPQEKKQLTAGFGVSRPRTSTESFFTVLDESSITGSTAEVFDKLDSKLDDPNMESEEFEMRAPYIPLSNELLMLSPDDLMWGADPEPAISPKHHASSNRDGRCSNISREESSLAQLLLDTDPSMTGDGPGRNLHLENSTGGPRNQYQQNKFLDGGGNFVDPNKVLPGHFAGKEELEGSSGSTLLTDPPPVLVQEPVEPPPPLLTIDTEQVSLPVKRLHSPTASPPLGLKKRFAMFSPQQQQQHNISRQEGMLQQQQQQQQQQSGSVRILSTPYAPTMQQLLVSKEPITVRGGRPSGASRNSLTDKGHSVLRNLLHEDGSIVIEDPQLRGGGGGGISNNMPTATYLPRERIATMVLARGEGSLKGSGHMVYPKLRLVTSKQQRTLMQAGRLAIKLPPSRNPSSSGGPSRRGLRQDPLLLVDPDSTIPNLLDLTQQDYEVNAPANHSLLQGADLLMALDQSL